jgi:peptidoglycan/xylan/chitin deacetylase (PgdA/CDA1 family)
MSGARPPSALRVGTVLGSTVAAANLAPSLACIAPLRRSLLPRLAGISTRQHIALTFDDGPDRRSTPRFLDLLAAHGVTATFFLLGAHVQREVRLVRDLAAAGHELGVHGWEHRCLALRPPGGLASELIRSRELIEDVTGLEPRWYRPPYGVMTGEGLRAARKAQLQTVLWSSWGCRLVPPRHRGLDRGRCLHHGPTGRNGAAPRHGSDRRPGLVATDPRGD